ncbi:hypothetical protein [Nostoc sp. UHCC 0251]|uniref:hypothetical protein n=1 Tax=Nostoc sp. UHCC 0251 TaxID=3110240 RepID=UPI002B201771|nr:hypothetical protein [Nostoc sp. UHCC 0251]MEA5624900.1 hypothetical protein [Nostoc sp. UHCC 0251]
MDKVNSNNETEARELTTYPERLRELYRSAIEVHPTLANNPNTPIDILQLAACDHDEYIRFFVARNPSTPADTLEMLAHDHAFVESCGRYVRSNVGLNPNTPNRILELLAQDIECVRQCVAQNPNLPIALLRTLAQDESSIVRSSVASNLSTPVDLLRLFASDKCEFTRCYVAKNPSTSADILESLSQDQLHRVRTAVAGNFHTSASTLERLFSNCQAIGNSFKNRDTMISDLAKVNFQATGFFDPDVWFQEYENFILAIAENPNTPLHILRILNCYPTGSMLGKALQNCVARNPNWNSN